MLRSTITSLLLTLCLTLQSACGTLLYPHRADRDPGHLDVGVVLMDAFWFLFGIVPGVVAFGVDIATGAIYVPESGIVRQVDSLPLAPGQEVRLEAGAASPGTPSIRVVDAEGRTILEREGLSFRVPESLAPGAYRVEIAQSREVVGGFTFHVGRG